MRKKLLVTLLAGVLAVGSTIPAMADTQETAARTVYVSVEKTLIYSETTAAADKDYILSPTVVTLTEDDGFTMKAVAKKLAEEGVGLKRNNNVAWTADSVGTASNFYISGIADPNAPSTGYIGTNGTGAFCQDKISAYKEAYWDPIYTYCSENYGEDMWEYLKDVYQVMSGWDQAVHYSGVLTGGDYNAYSGWMFTLDNTYYPGTDPTAVDWYNWNQEVQDGDTVRLMWSNCGGQDLGFIGEFQDLNGLFHYIGTEASSPDADKVTRGHVDSPFVPMVDKDTLVKDLAIINGSGETTTGVTAYTEANNILKTPGASQIQVNAAVTALEAAFNCI